MRAIVVRQPFANMIANGHKTVEYRSWPTYYRGPLLIVAGKSTAEPGTEPPYGVALCVVDLVRCDHLGVDGYAWTVHNVRRVAQVPIRGRLGLFNGPDPTYT